MSETHTEPLPAQDRLGRVMSRIRKEHGLQQKDVAARMHVHPDTLRRFEKGQQMPRPTDLQRFYEAIGITDDEAKEVRQIYLAVGTGVEESRTSQGEGAQQVFQSLYPLLYASIAPVNGAYDRQSEKCAALAEVYSGGLQGKRIMDIGCGYGSTSLAISAYRPREILAVDRSEGMIELLKQVLLSNTDLYVWLEAKGGEDFLAELYHRVVIYLRWMRASFQGSLFYQQGKMDTKIIDSLDIRGVDLGQFDVIIGNNFLHWPVNERRRVLSKADPELLPEQVTEKASRDALRPLASVLRPGGIVVFLEPKAFITLDEDENERTLDRILEENTYTEHPVYATFHKTIEDILEQDYGIPYGRPGKADLFYTSQLKHLVQQGGFELIGFHHVDVTHAGDPLAFSLATAPLVLGGVPLDFYEKVAIAKRVHRKLSAELKEGTSNTPIREQQFFLVLKRL